MKKNNTKFIFIFFINNKVNSNIFNSNYIIFSKKDYLFQS